MFKSITILRHRADNDLNWNDPMNVWEISSPNDLYTMYKDFVIDNDDLGKYKQITECIRDNYNEIFDKLPTEMFCDLETFENIVKKYIIRLDFC